MESHAGKSRSHWMATAHPPEFPPLLEDKTTNVVVIGAGITGLTTAYLLARAGHGVIVLDDGPLGGGDTERTTAHLSNALDDRYFELEKLHGPRGAQLAAQSHTAAIDEIERIITAEGMSCDFERVDGYLFVPPGQSSAILARELAAAHRAGLSGVTSVTRADLRTYDTGPALRFPRQAQFHPLRYLSGLARALVRDGGRIYTHSHVCEIKGGTPASVKVAAGHVVQAQSIVVATNSPVNDMLVIHTKQAAYRTFVIGATVPHGAVAKALYWDTGDPYHYVRVQTDPWQKGTEPPHDILLVGGEDHKTGQEDDAEARYARLERWARERFPISALKYRWSGQVMEPLDGLAFIGHNPADQKNVYVATGDSGNGLTHGTIAGILLRDMIEGRPNPWATLYDPARVTLATSVEFARENMNTAVQYGDWLTPGDEKTEREIIHDSGAIIRHGTTKVAAYRDEKGHLHQCSAVCPHLGGLVRWNHAEKTWDCPCHGSRFDRFGKVVNGPANADLAPVEQPIEAAPC